MFSEVAALFKAKKTPHSPCLSDDLINPANVIHVVIVNNVFILIAAVDPNVVDVFLGRQRISF